MTPSPNSAKFTPLHPQPKINFPLVLDYNLENVLHTILVVCGCLWLFVVVCGCLWLFVVVCGCLWLFVVVVCGCLWLFVVVVVISRTQLFTKVGS